MRRHTLGGRPPDDLAKHFAADTFTLTTHELAGKYGIAESIVRDWRLFCKRYLELAVGYGGPAVASLNKKDDPGPIADEGKRYEALFGDSEVALMTDIAAVEIWLTLVECDVVDENDQPVLKAGMPYEQFLAGLTAIWNYAPAIFWNIHRVVREANPQWQLPGDGEGNA
jgi:hypothetical protein